MKRTKRSRGDNMTVSGWQGAVILSKLRFLLVASTFNSYQTEMLDPFYRTFCQLHVCRFRIHMKPLVTRHAVIMYFYLVTLELWKASSWDDGISLISKVKPLKFCLMSKVFHGISLISKVFRVNESLDKTLELSQNV